MLIVESNVNLITSAFFSCSVSFCRVIPSCPSSVRPVPHYPHIPRSSPHLFPSLPSLCPIVPSSSFSHVIPSFSSCLLSSHFTSSISLSSTSSLSVRNCLSLPSSSVTLCTAHKLFFQITLLVELLMKIFLGLMGRMRYTPIKGFFVWLLDVGRGLEYVEPLVKFHPFADLVDFSFILDHPVAYLSSKSLSSWSHV